MVGMAGTSFLLSALVMTYAVTWSAADLKDEAPCASSIFCNGLLLKAAQNAMIYNDSKTFVDLHLKQSEDVILQAFGELVDRTDANVMREFVAEYFDGPNIEFEDWEPSDWKENPGFIDGIKDDELKEWARDLNELWKELGRQIKQDVLTNADRYSLIHVENPFIVPGGRFREFYYWDSYWIFKGLLLSEMTETVKGMLTNFVSISKSIGHVPNGNRVYYEKRSQPPFLIPSVYLYLQATDDIETIRTFLPDLEIEYQFWMTDRAIDITKDANVYTLNRYNVNMGMPRPESYREDIETADGKNEEEAAEVYSNLASAAESGWDFSTRWFRDGATLGSIRTKEIVPVDLNSVLCLSEWALYEMYNTTGNESKAATYLQAFNDRKRAISEVLWSEDEGAWFDYDIVDEDIVDQFYPSNIMPMWASCYDDTNDIQQQVLDYLKKEGVLEFPGGIPTSLTKSGQQWDYPNAWPPLQDIVIETLRKSDVEEANDYALKLAQNWTLTNWRAYKETDLMFEKYDVEKQGVPGHGGEYAVQAGFGWTNGVIMSLLDHYGDQLEVGETGSSGHATVFILLNVVCLFAALILARDE
ncbi:trehalase [Strongylocentrotus purpuratus]|uniref:Trehalase n=1 Tax=Strongylocentrotus purpuratus TaxID=7668 RepID=A0A7M7NAJ6_STRPU|nr:trehalase [Strongylocentrotus purpuratus]